MENVSHNTSWSVNDEENNQKDDINDQQRDYDD